MSEANLPRGLQLRWTNLTMRWTSTARHKRSLLLSRSCFAARSMPFSPRTWSRSLIVSGRCKRCIHYECLSRTGDENAATSREQHAQSYFAQTICHQCALWGTNLEVILAWAKGDPLPTANGDVEEGDVRTEIEVVKKKDEKTGRFFTVPSAKDPTANAKVCLALGSVLLVADVSPTQYLVKWKGESYRQLEWVPHAFLAASNFTRLAKFLAKGSQVSFEPPKDDILEEGEEEAAAPTGSAPPPDPDAADRIPRARSTVDRVLDVWYKSRQPGGRSVRHSDYSKLPQDPAESIQLVSECYFKWGDLPYSDCAFPVRCGRSSLC